MDSPVDHNDVRRERERRGWSVRYAANASQDIVSNTTWGNYEQTGNLTPKIRQAVSVAFGWPLSWPEVANQEDLNVVLTKLGELETLVRRLQAQLTDALRAGIDARADLIERVERLERRAESGAGGSTGT